MQVIQKIKFLLHRSLISGSSDPGPGNRLRCSRNNYIKNQRNIRIIGSVSLVLLLTISAFTLRPISAETSSAEATANPSTTTLTVETSDSTATLDITPTSPTGTFSSSDTSGTSLAFNVSTNNITGYNLSISHESATTPAPLINEDATNSSNPGSSSTTTNLDSLPSGTSISDSDFNTSAYVGYYGYKPSMLNSSSNSNYIPAPTTSSTTLNETAQANTTSDNYTIALGANIDYTKPAGTYTNTFILAAVANNVPYTINYLDNTGTGGTTGTDVSNLPDSESSSTATATNFTLSSTIPTRTGYTFAGWCYGTVTHNATGTDTCASSSSSESSAAGDGVTYQPDSTFSFANYTTSTNVANLYAMWNVNTFTIDLVRTNATAIIIDSTPFTDTSATLTYGTHTISGTYEEGYEFDSWTTSDSTNLAITDTSLAETTITVQGAATLTLAGKVSMLAMQDITPSQCTTTAQTVYDKRDNEQYLIQRLADENCWLLDNLRLGSAEFAVDTLDSTNTNTTTKSMPTTTFAGWNTTSGFSSYTAPMINTVYANNTTTGYGSGSNKIGVFYNYCAATMQSYCYASGSGTGNASQDICPKGWRIPTGGPSGEYQNLCNKVKGSTCSSDDTSTAALQLRNVLSTPLSGAFFNSYAGSQGSAGYFWSSTYSNGNYMYFLSVNSSSVNPQDNYDRRLGFSVRCVLNDTRTVSDVSNMQDVNSAVVTNTADGATATLRDSRDNQEYTVAKINGNLWMTRNLAIGCNGTGSTYGSAVSSKPLTADDSNVTNTSSSPWNTPTTSLTSGNSYDDPRMTCSSTYGAWYNYAAASAGTITGSSNSTADTYSICPKGWRLPTNSEQSDITSYSSAFSPVTGGYYYDGSINTTGTGFWWSATADVSTGRYFLYWNGSSLGTSSYYGYRYYGFYVRCIRSS